MTYIDNDMIGYDAWNDETDEERREKERQGALADYKPPAKGDCPNCGHNIGNKYCNRSGRPLVKVRDTAYCVPCVKSEPYVPLSLRPPPT